MLEKNAGSAGAVYWTGRGSAGCDAGKRLFLIRSGVITIGA
jgi:hypothetical protein